jgi:hypothetical protein
VDIERIEEELPILNRELNFLPEVEQSPPTTLQLLGDGTSEHAWQQYLVHLLNPEAAHGLNKKFLEHFLAGLAARPDLGFSFDRWSLETVQVSQEVSTDKGRPDVVIWANDDWYLLLELKIDAEEGTDQTDRYVDIGAFHGISLKPAGVSGESGDAYYIYLTPAGAPDPSNDEFAHVSWSWVANQLQSFVTDGRGAYPARTTDQLTDFIDTIQRELTMTEYQQNQQEKMALFVQYWEAIAEVESAFEDAWDEFQNAWGDRLAATLSAADATSLSRVPDEQVVVTLADRDERWIFRQTDPDWAWVFKDGWWRDLATGDPVYTYEASRPDARVGFLHRLDKHRGDAIQNGELKFFFRSTPPNVDSFDAVFDDAFLGDGDPDIAAALPNRMSFTGGPDTLLEGTYPIDFDDNRDFLDAYIDALATAFRENVVENPSLVTAIEEQYEAAFRKAAADE